MTMGIGAMAIVADALDSRQDHGRGIARIGQISIHLTVWLLSHQLGHV
jgi:hypothetical protein